MMQNLHFIFTFLCEPGIEIAPGRKIIHRYPIRLHGLAGQRRGSNKTPLASCVSDKIGEAMPAARFS